MVMTLLLPKGKVLLFYPDPSFYPSLFKYPSNKFSPYVHNVHVREVWLS